MRKLTVMRQKSFSACFAKMNVYIEDALFGDTEISGVKCRKLGELKNGEVKAYIIDEGKRKVFILSDSVPIINQPPHTNYNTDTLEELSNVWEQKSAGYEMRALSLVYKLLYGFICVSTAAKPQKEISAEHFRFIGTESCHTVSIIKIFHITSVVS